MVRRMVKPPDNNAAPRHPPGVRWSVDLRLTVWAAQDGWHARIVGADLTQHDFASPFELARFLTQAAPAAMDVSTPSTPRGGLR